MTFSSLLAQIWATLWPLATIIAVGLGLEQLLPAERGQSLRTTLLNIGVTASYVVMTVLLLSLLSPLISVAAANLGGGWMKLRFGESFSARVVQQITFLFVFDFFYYWTHRLQHASPFLWQQHKLHHSTPALNVAVVAAHHWLEEPIRSVSIILPMLVIFDLRPAEIGVLGTVIWIWPAFKHSNLRISLGSLTPSFVGPQLHRLHHSNQPEHQNKNFAAYFPIYDLLFGTYCAPKPGEWATTGLIDGKMPKGIIDANLWPFIGWWRMWRIS